MRLALMIVFVVAGGFTAVAGTLDSQDLREVFAGRTVYLSTPFGPLPIRYSSSGTMVARSKAMAVVAGIEQDTGSWRIAGNMFCQRWQVWLKGKEQCFTVRRDGATLHWVSDDGMSGTARAN